MYDLGLLEEVVGVTLLEFVVFDTEDSCVEGILGADGDISEGGSRIVEVFSIGYLGDNLLWVIVIQLEQLVLSEPMGRMMGLQF